MIYKSISIFFDLPKKFYTQCSTMIAMQQICKPITTASIQLKMYLQEKQVRTGGKHNMNIYKAKSHTGAMWPYRRQNTRASRKKDSHWPFLSYVPASSAQKASGSGQNREKSGISRFAMCQSTKRACINLNSRRTVGKSHHLSSSLEERTIKDIHINMYMEDRCQIYRIYIPLILKRKQISTLILTNAFTFLFHKTKEMTFFFRAQ